MKLRSNAFAFQVRSVFKIKRLTKIEIQQLQKEIENDEIASERVDSVSEMSYGGSSGAETGNNTVI